MNNSDVTNCCKYQSFFVAVSGMDQNTFHIGAQPAVVLHKFTFGERLSGSRIFSWNPKPNLCSCLISKLILFKQLWSRMRQFSRFYGFTCLSPTANFAQPRCFSSKCWLTSRFSDTQSFDKLPSLVNADRCLFYRSYETYCFPVQFYARFKIHAPSVIAEGRCGTPLLRPALIQFSSLCLRCNELW
jgi:hypothetical protein